ncbi:acyl-homoserine-lactone synthase [Alsobacter sp. R-9]
MILKLHAFELAQRPDLAEQMFRLRARVFHDRLRWDVCVQDGLERDVYDDCDPLYVLSVDEDTGVVRGAARLLPTTGRHMMRDIFNGFFDEPFEIESPLIWECTRFGVLPDLGSEGGAAGLNVATCELLTGVCEAALVSGVTQILGVSEIPMLRIYRRSGWIPEVIGRSARPGSVPVFAGLWDVSPEVGRMLRHRSGLPAADAAALSMAA